MYLVCADKYCNKNRLNPDNHLNTRTFSYLYEFAFSHILLKKKISHFILRSNSPFIWAYLTKLFALSAKYAEFAQCSTVAGPQSQSPYMESLHLS